MRPIRLEIEGLTAFADRAEVDFSELQLFAITGTTGAGKSTLIDAILLALFGKVPRVGAQYGQLIAHDKEQILLRLEFAAGGTVYRVARRIRRKGAAQVQLERVLDDGTAVPIAGKARDTGAEIERILGIGYDAFTRSVVLPQGQFDQFLRGDPAQRRKILVHLLGLSRYERMARLAGERHRGLQATADAATQSLARDFATATPAALAARQQELATVEHEQQQLGERADRLAAALVLAHAAVAARKDLAQRQAARGAVLRQHAEAVAERQRELQAGAAFAADRARLEAAVTTAAVDPTKVATAQHVAALLPPLLRALGERPQLQRDAATAHARLLQIEGELAAAAALLPALTAAVTAQTAELAAAETGFEAQQRADAAMHLRTSLHAGGTCPVCEQAVAAVPPLLPTAIDELRARVATARDLLRSAQRKHQDAERTRQQRDDDLPAMRDSERGAAERLRRSDAEVARARGELEAAGALSATAPLPTAAEIATLQREHERQLQHLLERERQRGTAQRELDALLQRHRDAAEQLAARSGRIEAFAAQLRTAEADLATHATSAATADQALVTALRELALDARGADPVAFLQQTAAAMTGARQAGSRRLGQLAAEIAQVQTAIARAAELRGELDAATAAAALARALTQLLRGDHFQDYVLEAAVQRLCDDGSERLLALSGGRYSLRHTDGDFLVVDHWNARRERSVQTLSGGETFLASLALSLALAEGIRSFAAGAGSASALECLFIDEGFGALDGDALEAAVQALEALQGGQRMVGVVTHLQALADRLPARIVVENRAGRARIAIA